METLFSANSAKIYECKFCNVKCSKKNDWSRHLSTDKHLRKYNSNIELKILTKNITCKCGKIYATKSGLWKHSKLCEFIENDIPFQNDNHLINIILKEY